MIISGWINIAITALLFATLIAVVVYYYRPQSSEKTARDEDPKWRMLSDEDEQPGR